MDPLQSFQDFLVSQAIDIPLLGFMLNLVLSGVLGFILARAYVRFGRSLSNRKQFSRNFVLLAMITTLVIAIVKSSLTLSLGLVGALSIVRFRAAIKEPEELTYLFLTIAIGLGLGADQRLVTLVAFVVVLVILWLESMRRPDADDQNLFLTVSSDGPGPRVTLKQITDLLKQHCQAVRLRRFDESSDHLEASFQVEYAGLERLEENRRGLRDLDESLKITYLDNRGIAS